MRAHQLSRRLRRHRLGFTWVELIVCFAIIGLLVALILPAINDARIPSHRVQCQSNLRNICLAVHSYATTNRGEVPPLTGGMLMADPGERAQRTGDREAPWTVAIMPYLEQSQLHNRLCVQPGWVRPSDVDLQQLAQTSIPTFHCPSPPNPIAGCLSYVANAGIMDEESWSTADLDTDHSAGRFDFGFNGYGAENLNTDDAELAYSTGLFWRVPVGTMIEMGTPAPLTLDQVSAADGTSQTVLFTENLNTRSYNPPSGTGGWISNATGDLAFGISVPGTRDGTAFRVALSDSAGGLGEAGGAKATSLTLSKDPVPPNCQINANGKDAVNGRSPRPSSNHPGIVNMAFADGACRSISDLIEPSVYARLLSPMGGRHGQYVFSVDDY